MSKDSLDSLFERLHGEFDVAEPQKGHHERFLEKLNQKQGTIVLQRKKTPWWKPLSIAASIALVAILGYQAFGPQPNIKLTYFFVIVPFY